MWFEKRKHTRVRPHPSQPVEVQLMGSGFLDVLHPLDVSEGGMSVAVPHRFEGCDLNGEIEVLVKLPKARPFVIRAIVRHRRGSQDKIAFGLEFKDLNESARARIAEYVVLLAAQGRTVL